MKMSVIVLFFLGCAVSLPSYQVPSVGQLGRCKIVLQPIHYENRNNADSYSIFLYYSGVEPIYLREGESLIFLINDKITKVRADGLPNEFDPFSTDHSEHSEKAYYPVDFPLMEKLAFADSVRFRVIGKTYFLEGNLSKENIRSYRDFVRQFKPNEASHWLARPQ